MENENNAIGLCKDNIAAIRSFQRSYSRRLGLLNLRADKRIPYSLIPLRILYEIQSNPGCTTVYLADYLILDRSVVSRNVKMLTNEGYITKSVSKSDGRVYFLNITEAGKDYVESAVDFSEDMVKSKILDYLSPEDGTRLAYHLAEADRILRNIHKDEYAEDQ